MILKLAGVLVFFAVNVGVAQAAGPQEQSTPALAPCIEEDQTTPCVWDATKQGNGLGRSFVVNPDGTRTYTTD